MSLRVKVAKVTKFRNLRLALRSQEAKVKVLLIANNQEAKAVPNQKKVIKRRKKIKRRVNHLQKHREEWSDLRLRVLKF